MYHLPLVTFVKNLRRFYVDQMSLRSQLHYTIGMFTYGRTSHEAEGVLHGKKDAAVSTLASQGNFYNKTPHFTCKVKVLTRLGRSTTVL